MYDPRLQSQSTDSNFQKLDKIVKDCCLVDKNLIRRV
jgi:hypothetical protein